MKYYIIYFLIVIACIVLGAMWIDWIVSSDLPTWLKIMLIR